VKVAANGFQLGFQGPFYSGAEGDFGVGSDGSHKEKFLWFMNR
jgi:hypothetical protein